MSEGGAEIVPFPVDYRPREDEGLLDALVRCAGLVRAYLGADGQKCAGFFVVGVLEDGTYSTGWRVDAGSKALSATMLGALVAEIARREIVTQSEVVHVLNRRDGCDDDGA